MRILLFILFLACLSTSCCWRNDIATKEAELSRWIEQVSPCLREGDLVFRKGIGIAGQIVTMAGGSDEIYSHIGIVVCPQDSSGWFVCHAVPGEPEYEGDIDRVKCEPIESFFSPQKSSRGKVVRVSCVDSVAHKAATATLLMWRQSVPFDHDYDWMDTTAFYCTQLVAWAYALEGIDLVEDRSHPARIPCFNGDYVFPSDIEKSDLLTYISYY